MKDYTVTNLIIFREYYPNLYRILRNKTRDSLKYELMDSRSGLRTLQYTNKDKQILTPIHSKYDPMNEAEKWIGQQYDKLARSRHIIIYGFGLGYHIEKLIYEFPDVNLYIYEPDIEIMLASMEARDLSSILKHSRIISFAVGNEEQVRRSFLQGVLNHIKDSVEVLQLPSYSKLFAEQINQMNEDMQKSIMDVRGSMHTAMKYQNEWTENILKNMPKVLTSNSMGSLKNVFKDTPAIIVGSGPSLAADIEYIRKLKEKCVVIAAGSSIQAFLHHELSPHFVVSMDGSEMNYKVFKDLDMGSISLVFSPMIKYKILENMESENLYHLFFNNDNPSTYLYNLNEQDLTVFTTASVTGTAIQMAVHLGCTDIILMGQDFSFPEDQFYAEGVKADKARVERVLAKATLQVPNVNGGYNKTTPVLLNTLHDTELLISKYDKQVGFVNTSKVGARIRGTESKPIEKVYHEIMDRYADNISVEEITRFNRAKLPASKVKRTRYRVQKSLDELSELGDHLLVLNTMLHKIPSLIGKMDLGKLTSLLDQIDSEWQLINKYAVTKHMLSFTLQVQISIFLRFVPDINEAGSVMEKAELLHKHLRKLIQNIMDVTPFLEQELSKAIERIDKSLTQGVEVE
ncbi:hypothetical protein XYCOK13_28020 [Xylanibacillus composti]|uniref:DUF115 domain-containing protein n=1 Tax=Xylanibacillus composti TaxID=1572762 RepID=A0A8J4H7I1_9BACL|nr:6-hydroxymethylpterin diphosphokinase MptE-like protein [Xylanibacillus composti]GIQ69978.1 hypothetical protein XYCOK13_28020 [Xylanibacillus composti]